MDALRYVNELTPSQIRQTQKESHELWGAGMNLDERVERLQELLRLAGRERFRLSGLANDHGYVPVSMKRYELVISIGGQPMRTLGVGAVFASEASRKIGLATQLLNHVLEEATQEGYELAILFSDIAPGYYYRFGFMELPAWRYYFDLNALPKDRPLEVRTTVSADIPRMLAWYEKGWPSDYTRPVRDEFRWKFFRQRIGNPLDLIFNDGVKEVGYVTLSEGKAGSIWVDELVVSPDFLDRAWATIAKLAREKKVDQLRGFLPYFNLPEVVSEKEKRVKAIPMLKALRPGTLDAIVPERAHFNSPDLF